MSKRKDSKRDKAKRQLAGWYQLKPVSLALPVLLFIGLWIPPLARGESLEWSLFQSAIMGTVVAMLLALLAGWIAWRVGFKSVWLANTIFCLAVIGCGVWSIALSDIQRARAQEGVASTIDQQVGRVKQQVLAAVD